MGFSDLGSPGRGGRKLVDGVRLGVSVSQHANARFMLSEDLIDRIGARECGRVHVHLGEGPDAGWLRVFGAPYKGGSTYALVRSCGSTRSRRFVIATSVLGLKRESRSSRQIPHRIVRGALLIELPADALEDGR